MKDSSKKWKAKIQLMQLLLQHRLVRLQKKAGSTGHRATKELPESHKFYILEHKYHILVWLPMFYCDIRKKKK